MFAVELRTVDEKSNEVISVEQIVVSNNSLKAIESAMATMSLIRQLLISQGFCLITVNTNQAHFIHQKKGISAFFTMIHSY